MLLRGNYAMHRVFAYNVSQPPPRGLRFSDIF